MASIPLDPAHGGHAHDDHHDHHPTGLKRWLTTTNHKDIGTMYLWFSFTMFIVGGIMAMIIRAELFQPGLQIVKPEFFNQLTSLHGLIMVFGAIMPAFENVTVKSGASSRLTPPASATAHSPACRLRHARCTATSEDEQAVSTARLGPCSPKEYDSRPAAALNAFPVPS